MKRPISSLHFLLFFVTLLQFFPLRLPADPVQARHGMVVSSQPLASQVGVEILKAGGNAVDAAVATGFALAVVHPTAGNIGGGGFMVIRFPDGSATCIDYREKAPAKADRDMYLKPDGTVDAQKSRQGILAVGVPGSVAGLCYAVQKYGSLPLAKVLQPAIELAEKGFPVTAGQARDFQALREDFARYPCTAKVFLKPDGSAYQQGENFRQPDLAETLKRIARSGAQAFYTGAIADLIVQEMKRHDGLITKEDLLNYRAVERRPIRGTFREYQIISMPPPSSGGIVLVEMLNILQPMQLRSLGHNSAAYVHLLAEAMRSAFADRAKYLGDPDFVAIPVAGLLSKSYAATLREDIPRQRARNSLALHNPDPTLFTHESEETTHYSVVDEKGMAVSVTTTLNGGYGSLIVVDGAGFLLNNEMDDFTARPGVPNMYGLVQGQANAIEPNKRMLSSMTPTIITRDDRLYMVIGSPGGPTIINTVLQIFLNAAIFDMDIEQAISAPRFHHQWLPDRISYERDGFSPDVIEELERMGHHLAGRRRIGEAEGILYNASGQYYSGYADKRGEGGAVGY